MQLSVVQVVLVEQLHNALFVITLDVPAKSETA